MHELVHSEKGFLSNGRMSFGFRETKAESVGKVESAGIWRLPLCERAAIFV